MRRALLVVLVSLVAIALIALKSSAQSTSPRVSAEEENKVLKQLLGEANAKSDRLGDQLSQMQQANQRLEQEIEKKDKEIAQLRLRVTSAVPPHIRSIPGFELRDPNSTAPIPPGWIPQQFNGQAYYLVPIADGSYRLTPAAVQQSGGVQFVPATAGRLDSLKK
jgi:hypothetical protein